MYTRYILFSCILLSCFLGDVLPVKAEYNQDSIAFDPSVLNHNLPETKDGTAVYTPIQYQAYFRAERALFSYYPRFQPAYVSFDLSGKPYLEYGSFIIQSVDSQGQWSYQDIGAVVESYVKNILGYADLKFSNTGQSNEVTIRFDSDGDAYLSCLIEVYSANGASGGKMALLLHSKDNLNTWTVYQLPYTFVRFEKLDGNNQDCLNRPPVVLMSSAGYGEVSNYITIPEKQPDGTLVIPTPVKISDNSVGFAVHSGDANFAITRGNKVFIVYSMLSNWPTIPTTHPQYNMTYIYNGQTVYSRDGTPAFAVSYDINTKALSPSVFIGFGGHTVDTHNWPALTIDNQGYLHAIVNGHHTPFTYTAATLPNSVDNWNAPELVSDGTSYATLNCDKFNTLYAVTRCSRVGYRFRLALHRKKAGQGWENENYLVLPFKPYYKVWTHKMSLDTITNRLFLTYYAQSLQISVFKSEYDAYINIWPDREIEFMKQTNGTVPTESQYKFYLAPPSEMCTIVSEDGGSTWHLTVTDDYLTP